MTVDFTVGELNFPATADTSTLKTLDPIVYELIDFLQYWLNRELGSYFATTMSNLGLPYPSIISPSNCIFCPLQFVANQELQNVPLLVIDPIDEDEQDWTSVQKCNARKFEINYILAPLSAGLLTAVYPFLGAVNTLIKHVLYKNTKDNTSLIFSNCDFKIGKSKYGAVTIGDSAGNGKLYPTVKIELIIRDYRQTGPDLLGAVAAAGVDVTAANLDVNDPHQPPLATDFNFTQSVNNSGPPY
jgi:hypothetical protein